MKRSIIGLLIGLSVGTGTACLSANAETAHVPAGVIDSIHGMRSTGFVIRYGDNTRVRVPSLGMALTECRDGLDTEGRDAYMRCIGHVRAEYDGYVALRNTLNAKGVNR